MLKEECALQSCETQTNKSGTPRLLAYVNGHYIQNSSDVEMLSFNSYYTEPLFKIMSKGCSMI